MDKDCLICYIKYMQTFKHTPDNQIIINDLVLTLEQFLTVVPEYKLPDGFRGAEYTKGKFHRLYTSNNEIYLDKNWADGDLYIEMYDGLKASFGDVGVMVTVGTQKLTKGELLGKQVEMLSKQKLDADKERKEKIRLWNIEQKKLLKKKKEDEKALLAEQGEAVTNLSSNK